LTRSKSTTQQGRKSNTDETERHYVQLSLSQMIGKMIRAELKHKNAKSHSLQSTIHFTPLSLSIPASSSQSLFRGLSVQNVIRKMLTEFAL
jgi:hypothetical protein